MTLILICRRIRESRHELRKFMRDVKRGNPAARVAMQYDKLYVDNKCFIWNDVQGRVTEHMAVSRGWNDDLLICREYSGRGG